MAILSARTCVQVPPMTSEVFICNKVAPLNNWTHNAKVCAMYNKLAQSYQEHM